MKARAYLALGSNMGEREQTLLKAVQGLKATEGIELVAVSSIYETDPFGYTEQEPFLNMAVAIDTSLSPDELLGAALRVEQQLGRVRTIRWGPRTIDIDVLLYGDEHVQLPHLQIPHPGLTERAFVLVPLHEVCDGANTMVGGRSIEQWLADNPDRMGVRVWGTLDWETESVRFES